MGTIMCKKCSLPNPSDYRFCASCGRELTRHTHITKVLSSWSDSSGLQTKNTNRRKGLLRLFS